MTRPIRHPDDSKGCLLRSDESHFGRAAHAVFTHAAYTFIHLVSREDNKWIALACLHRAGVSLDVIRRVAAVVDLDLGEETFVPDRSSEACDPPDACATHGRCWTHSAWAETEKQ